MDDYQGDKNIKKESAMDVSNAGARIADASSILDVSQTIQQLLAMSSIAGSAILSPMQLLSASASSGAGTSQLSLPWIMPHHYQQMMVLQQGLTQPFLMSDVIDDNKDGHVVVMPTVDQGNQYNNVSAVSSPADASTAQHNLAGVSDSASRLLNYHLAAAQKPATKESVTAAQMVAAGGGASQKGAPVRHGQVQSDASKMPRPRPPKKPLTPYMLFSKEMWHQVKAANSHLSLVTEIGAIIGSMWRELDASKKERYNELFSRDKIRYDEEIRLYLKNNNMHPSDLIRARLSKKKDSKIVNQHRPQVTSHASTILNPPGQQLVQSLLGYPVVDGSQALVSLDGSLPNNFMQAWAGQPVQQILAQMGLAGQLVQANSDESHGGDANGNSVASQPLALSAHAMFTNASVCGSEQTALTRTSDSSSVGRYSNETGIDATDKSKSWSWSGQPMETDHGMQSNYEAPGTDKDADTASTSRSAENPLAGQSSETASQVVAAYWNQLKRDGEDKSDEIRQLETRLLYLENALCEKNKEVEKLTTQLEKAHQVIGHFQLQQQQQQSVAENQSSDQNGTDCSSNAVTGVAHQ